MVHRALAANMPLVVIAESGINLKQRSAARITYDSA
jgi:hypothetical protein